MTQDKIVDIPPNRIKFFGGAGKMLLPSQATVESALNQVPPNKLVTTSRLCQKLSNQFNVEGTCPVTTKKAIVALAKDSGKNVPYWRVVNQNGGLVSQFPGGVESQATLLREAGFTIETTGKGPKVKNLKENLVRLE
jgi:hypothetical protein